MVLFIAGTIICALAHNVPTILVGRVLEGAGSGGGLSLIEIIITDMVPLKFRASEIFGALLILSNADPKCLGYLFWHDFDCMGIGGRIITLDWWCFHGESDVEVDILDHSAIVSSFSKLPSLTNRPQHSGFSHNTTNFSSASSQERLDC
jgi:MFS family permease